MQRIMERIQYPWSTHAQGRSGQWFSCWGLGKAFSEISISQDMSDGGYVYRHDRLKVKIFYHLIIKHYSLSLWRPTHSSNEKRSTQVIHRIYNVKVSNSNGNKLHHNDLSPNKCPPNKKENWEGNKNSTQWKENKGA